MPEKYTQPLNRPTMHPVLTVNDVKEKTGETHQHLSSHFDYQGTQTRTYHKQVDSMQNIYS